MDGRAGGSYTQNMDIRINAEHQAWLEERIASGRFASAEHAIDEALVLLEAREGRMPTPREPGKKSLAQLFMEGPFRGLDIEFPRDNSPWPPKKP